MGMFFIFTGKRKTGRKCGCFTRTRINAMFISAIISQFANTAAPTAIEIALPYPIVLIRVVPNAIIPVNKVAVTGTCVFGLTFAKNAGTAFSLAAANNILEEPNKQPTVEVPVAVNAAIAINTAPTPGRTVSIANDKGAVEAARRSEERRVGKECRSRWWAKQ